MNSPALPLRRGSVARFIFWPFPVLFFWSFLVLLGCYLAYAITHNLYAMAASPVLALILTQFKATKLLQTRARGFELHARSFLLAVLSVTASGYGIFALLDALYGQHGNQWTTNW
jgi:hypothetical protein